MAETEKVAEQTEHYESGTVPRWIPIGFVVVVAALGWLLYQGHTSRQMLEVAQADITKERQKAEMLAVQLEQANTRVAELKSQFDFTSQKLGLTQEELDKARAMSTSIRKEQKASDDKILAQLGQVQKESEEKLGAISGEVKGAKSDIEATRKELEATKGKLERTVGDLGEQSGLIARNHEEVEELKRRGERNIFEFDLKKSKQMQRIGPIQMQLKKADVKKFKYTLTVFADDKQIEKKDKTVNEPVQFYVARMLYEVVVFELSKDRAVGYLTTPKEAAAARK